MNSSVIIVAAGKGKRFREKTPKQYVNLGCESIINLTIKKFINIKEIKYILPVINAKHIELYHNNINKLSALENFKKILPPCTGGNERCVSVRKGLETISKIRDNPSRVLIHDAARPFVSKKIIKKVINKLENFDAVLPCINFNDTIWKIKKDQFNLLTDRRSYFRAQTPQGFKFNKILKAHLNNDETWAYDDIYLAKKNNFKITKILGSEFNIKITKPEDLQIAERYLK
jgi:2-C-methyl-D-erythritol 4-phosphate cytidylyltransferase